MKKVPLELLIEFIVKNIKGFKWLVNPFWDYKHGHQAFLPCLYKDEYNSEDALELFLDYRGRGARSGDNAMPHEKPGLFKERFVFSENAVCHYHNDDINYKTKDEVTFLIEHDYFKLNSKWQKFYNQFMAENQNNNIQAEKPVNLD